MHGLHERTDADDIIQNDADEPLRSATIESMLINENLVYEIVQRIVDSSAFGTEG
jgi:hypothetical protein